jgi:hypothetical protein
VVKSSLTWYNIDSTKNLIKPSKERVMIISENIEKVKRKASKLISKSGARLSKPEKKFVLEMMMGMLISGSSNISEIGRSLKEHLPLKYTIKRLERMLTHDHILGVCNQLCVEESVNKIDKNTIIALDEGDTIHKYGEKFEYLNGVRDGSTGEFAKGYRLNQICGYNPGTHETFPIGLELYSTKEKGHKSTTVQTLNLVNSTLDLIGTQGLWVMDRGYDNGFIIDNFGSKKLNFVTRMNTGSTSRNVLVDGQSVNIVKAAKGINRRIKFDKNCRFGALKIELKPKYRKYQMTLICFKDKRNKEPILLLTNGWIKSSKELKRRIKGYFRRWGVEESYRFEKQGFGIEKATVRKYSRKKTLIGITLISWLLLTKINQAPKLKKEMLKQAKMEKNKTKHLPKFIYYRLLKGIQYMFNRVEELFRFRWKKKKKDRYRKEVKNQRLLFPQMHPNLSWMELPT